MRMILFSDVHLNEDSADVVLGKVLPGLRESAVQSRISQLAMLGDFWHVRYRVDVRIQNALKDELRAWADAGLELRVLPGNHDQVDRSGRNALEVFDEMRNVRVFTEPDVDGDGFWIPYRKRASDVQAILDRFQSQHMTRVCFAHVAIKGALMNDARADTDGLPADLFQNFCSVIMGHYHKRQTWVHGSTRFVYVGSVREVTLNEAGQDKGYAVWDGSALSWVTTDWAPRIHKLEVRAGQSLDLSGIRPGDDVRVTAGPNVNIEELGKALEAMQVRHTVTPEVQATQLRLDVGAGASMEQYAQAFVDRVASEGADKERLMSVYRAITQKVTA